MDLEQENRKLRQQLMDLHREAQRSQVTLERYHARELELMSADTLAELLHIMTEGMLASFKVDTLQLLIADPEHEIRHLLSRTTRAPLAPRHRPWDCTRAGQPLAGR